MIEIGGQAQEIELKQTQTTTVKTTDKSALPKAEKGKESVADELQRLREENARLRYQLQAVREALEQAKNQNGKK
jgi:hypothetical protein